MTPRGIRARTRVLGLSLLLAFAGGDAQAGDLYRWVTPDGRSEIGAHPPAGVAAEPWNPGQEAVAHPEPPAAPAPSAMPAAAKGRPTDAERAARGRLEETCSTDQAVAAKATQKIRVLEARIARLEQRREELEASELAFSQTSCRTQGIEGPSSDCMTSSFHRDAEISRTQQEIEEAQQKVADLEQRVRNLRARPECTPAAPAPE